MGVTVRLKAYTTIGVTTRVKAETTYMTVLTDTLKSSLTDAEVVDRVRRGETALFEILMRRHNQRVYRVARAVVKDEAEAEDVMQQAYINAFVHLKQFEDRSQFSTWLTRIALHEALSRRRTRRPEQPVGGLADGESPGDDMESLSSSQPDPERQAYAAELGRILEAAVDALPENYRAVFMLREIEGLSTTETASGLDLGEEAVKTRLHRARAMVRRTITDRLGSAASEAFQFHAVRCDRVVAGVLREIVDGGLAPR
jgi:RNA polymerase sigma-70 factor (ECF subfamily)